MISFSHLKGHFLTVARHRALVRSYCFRAGLILQGLTHDLSKYSWAEFPVGVRYFQGTRSPNNAEREATGVSRAWLHHKGRNRHHFEYWIDYSTAPKNGVCMTGMKMPRRYVAEMIFDRVSASRIYQGDAYTDGSALAYYLAGRSATDPFIHEETRRDLERLLRMWAEQGEEATIAYIRHVYLKHGS